jgi:RNA-binding protein
VTLTGKQRRQLRSLGHHLHAVVQVGDAGVTDGVVAATSQALLDHELVKVRISDDREGREGAIEALAGGTGAEVAQVLGRTVLLFKRHPTEPKLRFDGEVLPPPVAPAVKRRRPEKAPRRPPSRRRA